MKKQKLIIYIAYAMALALLAIIVGQLSQMFYNKCEKAFTDTFFSHYAYAAVEFKAPSTKELPMKEWIKNEIENAGISWDEASKIIDCESKGRPDICIIEPNGTISCGLWMLNTIHNKQGLTNACKVDYKCSTRYAIKLYNDWGGNWNAWTCGRKLGF